MRLDNLTVTITIMSGADDGSELEFATYQNGERTDESWTLTIGRRDENDLCLRNDTFVSRRHASLHWKNNAWWLEDRDSTNGTFTEAPDDFFNDQRVSGIVPIEVNQLFRIGRTWLRIQPLE